MKNVMYFMVCLLVLTSVSSAYINIHDYHTSLPNRTLTFILTPQDIIDDRLPVMPIDITPSKTTTYLIFSFNDSLNNSEYSLLDCFSTRQDIDVSDQSQSMKINDKDDFNIYTPLIFSEGDIVTRFLSTISGLFSGSSNTLFGVPERDYIIAHFGFKAAGLTGLNFVDRYTSNINHAGNFTFAIEHAKGSVTKCQLQNIGHNKVELKVYTHSSLTPLREQSSFSDIEDAIIRAHNVMATLWDIFFIFTEILVILFVSIGLLQITLNTLKWGIDLFPED